MRARKRKELGKYIVTDPEICGGRSHSRARASLSKMSLRCSLKAMIGNAFL